MPFLDATVVNVALPRIQEALGFSGSGLEWVVNAYALAPGGLLLLGGRIGDLLGRRRTYFYQISAHHLDEPVTASRANTTAKRAAMDSRLQW